VCQCVSSILGQRRGSKLNCGAGNAAALRYITLTTYKTVVKRHLDELI
jgi:hypothetical protein